VNSPAFSIPQGRFTRKHFLLSRDHLSRVNPSPRSFNDQESVISSLDPSVAPSYIENGQGEHCVIELPVSQVQIHPKSLQILNINNNNIRSSLSKKLTLEEINLNTEKLFDLMTHLDL